MNLHIRLKLFTAVAGVFLAARLFAAETNQWATPSTVTREEVANNYLHIQEQIHESQLAIEKNQQDAIDAAKINQQAALDAAKSNADALAARLQSLEDTVAKQRVSDAEAAHKTQQTTLFLAGAFGLAGLGIMLLMVYFQWRAFTQLAQISSQQHNALSNGNAVHQLAAPGRATVETANAQLLSVVDRLEQRIHELESGQKLLPEIVTAAAAAKPSDLLTEGQKHLDANAPLNALECFDKYLAANPERADGLVKRAAALEKLGREDEALQCYNRAITSDHTLVIAHLHKGGLLNRMRRYDEALNCYEQALLAQEKKNGAK
jgi:tetratricopeptide (TPR) repeat protein